MKIKLPPVPDDFPVKVLGPDDPATDRTTCGTCGRSWDDAVSTEWTPAPSARCPFEYFHPEVEEESRLTHGFNLNYERQQLQRVLDGGPHPEIGDVFRLKITGANAETKWLSLSADQVRAIADVLDEEL